MLTGRRRPAARLFWRWRFVTGLRGQDTWGQGTVRFWTCGQKKSMILMNSNLTMQQLMWPGLTLPMTGLYQAWDNRTERLDKGRMCTCTCWCTCSILNWEGNKMVNIMQCSRYIICYLRWSDWRTQGTSLLFPFSILGKIVGEMRAVWYRGGWSILHL